MSIFLNSLKGDIKSINYKPCFFPCHYPLEKKQKQNQSTTSFSGNPPISMSFRPIVSLTGKKNVIEKKIGKQLPLLTEHLSKQTVRHASLKMYIAFILQLVLHGWVHFSAVGCRNFVAFMDCRDNGLSQGT